jgi:tetratricopeptide (TPR) repeat protein
MNSLIEQSQAYWHLGMTAEARALAKQALALERDASDGDTTGPAAEWCALLAFNCGEFDGVATRGQREPRFPETSPAISFVALSLHYLGRHAEAVEALAPRLLRYDRPHDHYQMACFLAQAGRADEAVAQLLQSLPHCRDDRLKTWIDGDLKRLWPMLAEGKFSLETAHRLLELEFDILREWQPARREEWPIDPPNFNDLPARLRPLFDPVPQAGAHRLIPGASLAAPALVERLDKWACDEIAASQRAFDVGRGIALRLVLDAQPYYAQAAWHRRDLCALRQHVHWAVRHDPARIHEFEGIPGIEPLVDEVRQMLASDPEFFAKLERVCHVLAHDTDAALEILESLPREWSSHPLVLMHHAYVLMAESRHTEALAVLLRVCDQWPDDVAPFFNASRIAFAAGRKELIIVIYDRAPRAVQFYRGWTEVGVWLKSTGDAWPFGALEVKKCLFRGQPDLAGHLAIESKPVQ